MIRAIMHGCGGKMGRTITELAAQDDVLTIVAGIDPTLPQDCPYPVFATAQECDTEADVVIDFSIAPAMDSLFNWCEARRLPLVLCTTGLSEEQLAGAKRLSETTAVLRSATIKSWMHQAEPLSPWQILSKKAFPIPVPMYTTEARYAKSATSTKSGFPQYAAERLSGSMKSFSPEPMKSSNSSTRLIPRLFLLRARFRQQNF